VKRKRTLKILVGVALVTVLAVSLPLMAGCRQAPPEEVVTPPPAEVVTPPPEEVVTPPPEAKVITAKIGFNAPLTGPVAGWGLPGFYGDEIWAEHINAAGGIVTNDGTRVLVELIPYDNEYMPDKSLAGARKLVLEDEVVIVEHLCGPATTAPLPFYTKHQMLSTTLTPAHMSPAAPYLTAPIEVAPLEYVPQAVYIQEKYPEAKRAAIAVQDDSMGRNHFALMIAACRAAGFEIVYEKLFDEATVDFAPIVSAVLDTEPDMFWFCGAYPDFVNLLCQQLYEQGFEGVKIAGTLDFYWDVIEKTSPEFMEGTLWVFPDFDDPMLTPSPKPDCTIQPIDFWNEYDAKYPGTWSAVSWEYADILDVWKQGVIYSNSIEPMDVLRAWKEIPTLYNTFGEAEWWGKEVWGSDNALVGKWPVVEMQNERGRIVLLYNLVDWYDEYGDFMVEANEEHHEMWYQVMGLTREQAMAVFPGSFE